MGIFRKFIEREEMEEEKGDIARTLNKIPASHANLVKGYRWKFHAGNTLNGDDQHVGYMDDGEKEIAVAGPWNYGREFTILHEIAHRVWGIMPNKLKKQWHQIVANTENKQEQEPEELFCHAYATAYTKHPPATHYKEKWIEFIKNLPV